MSQQIELYQKLNFHKLGSPTVGGTITCTATGCKILIGSQPGESTATVIDGYGVSMADDYSATKYSFGTSYRLYALEINADTGSVDMTGDVNAGAIKGRFVIGTTQTNMGASAIVGTLDVASGKNLISSQNGVCGVLDFYGNTTIGGTASHASALVGVVWNEGTTTINGTSVSSVSGLDLVQNSGTPTCTAGINPAILIRGGSSSAWQYGVYMTASHFTTGMYIGTCTTGINIEGTVTLALGIGSTTALTTATNATNAVLVQSNYSKADGGHNANVFNSAYTGTGVGTVRTIVGYVNSTGTQTTATTAQYLVGIHGRAKITGSVDNTSLFVTGAEGQILDGGTWTHANHISSIWADWQNNNDISAVSSSELLYMSNNASSTTGNPLHVFYIYAPRMTNFIAFEGLTTTAGSMVTASTTGGTMTHTIKCLIGATAYYLHLFDA